MKECLLNPNIGPLCTIFNIKDLTGKLFKATSAGMNMAAVHVLTGHSMTSVNPFRYAYDFSVMFTYFNHLLKVWVLLQPKF